MASKLALIIVSVYIGVTIGFGQRSKPALIDGPADGRLASKAPLYGPTGLAIGGNYLYIVESGAKRLRRVDLETGVLATLAGGGKQCRKTDEEAAPSPSCFGDPQRVAVDSLGNAYVTDEEIEGVVKIAAKTESFSIITAGIVPVLSGEGPEQPAELEWPAGIAMSPSGGLFFDDYTRHTVFLMTVSGERLKVVAGTGSEGDAGNGGPAPEAGLSFPEGLTTDAKGNLFIADSGNCRIQRVTAETGIVTTITGTAEGGVTCDGLSKYGVSLDTPSDVAVNQDGDVFFVLPYRQRVESFDPRTRVITSIAGNGEEGFTGDGGPAAQARLHFPEGIVLDRAGNLFISDSYNGRVRRVDAKTGIITTVAGDGPLQHDIML